MRRSRFRALPPSLLSLGAMAAALVGIIGLELYDSLLVKAPTSAAPARQQSGAPPTSGPGERPRDEGDQYIAIILERPLFSPSRHPDVAAKSDTATDLARLTGVLVSPIEKSAIFAGPAGAKPTVVGEGAHIGKYVVSSIDAGGVTVIGPSGQRVLHPAFDPSPPHPKQAGPALIDPLALLELVAIYPEKKRRPPPPPPPPPDQAD